MAHWFEESFYRQRIDLLKKQLSPKNKKILKEMSYSRQKSVIQRMIKRGKMI